MVITFAPTDSWLSRIVDPQLATQIMFIATLVLFGAALGGLCEIGMIAWERFWRSRHT
jgi:hypothetical protein